MEWWVRAAKQKIRNVFTRVGTEKRQEESRLEIFCYQRIYDILQNPQRRLDRIADVTKFKANIVKLHSVRKKGTKVDLDHLAVFNNERASIYHIVKQKKRRKQRTITKILDQAGRTQTTEKGIVQVIQDFPRNKFEPIRVDNECVRRMVEAGHGRMTEVGRETVDRQRKNCEWCCQKGRE
jgi:hypothetical protein